MKIKYLNRLYLALLAGYLPCQALLILFVYSAFGQLVLSPTILNTAAMLAVVWMVLHGFGCSIRSTFPLGRVLPGTWLRAVLCAVTLELAKLLFLAMLPLAGQEETVVTRTLEGSSAGISWLLLALIPAMGEEYLFRGVFYRLFRERTSIGAAVIASSIYFALMHFQLEHLFTSMLLGICSALFVEQSQSLMPSFVLHLMGNSVPVLLTILSRRQSDVGVFGWLFALNTPAKGALALLLAAVSLGLAAGPMLFRDGWKALWKPGAEKVTGPVTAGIAAVWILYTFVLHG